MRVCAHARTVVCGWHVQAKNASKKQHRENEAKLKAAMKQHKQRLKELAKGVKKAIKQRAKIEQAVAAEALHRKQALELARAEREEERGRLEEEEKIDKKARDCSQRFNTCMGGWCRLAHSPDPLLLPLLQLGLAFVHQRLPPGHILPRVHCVGVCS